MFLSHQGTLDVLLLTKEIYENNLNSIKNYKLIAFKNEMYDDVYFLKVMGKLKNVF